MIYCVVPQELGNDVFTRLEVRYADNPNVTVIWERRRRERRTNRGSDEKRELRELRDRRRRRPGEAGRS